MMAIQPDHLIVPSQTPIASAQNLAHILGVPWDVEGGQSISVYVSDALILDFVQHEHADGQHYCFRMNGTKFDSVLTRLRAAGIGYRSTPLSADDMQLNTHLGGRNVYWTDRDGHVWEVLTAIYAHPHPSTTMELTSPEGA